MLRASSTCESTCEYTCKRSTGDLSDELCFSCTSFLSPAIPLHTLIVLFGDSAFSVDCSWQQLETLLGVFSAMNPFLGVQNGRHLPLSLLFQYFLTTSASLSCTGWSCCKYADIVKHWPLAPDFRWGRGVFLKTGFSFKYSADENVACNLKLVAMQLLMDQRHSQQMQTGHALKVPCRFVSHFQTYLVQNYSSYSSVDK